MTDAELHRVDQILTELIDTVETARAVPMSTSCVVPRERMLDLFDDLRDVLPPEMLAARKVIAERDDVVAEAQRQAADLRERAEAHAREVIAAAEVHARELIEAGQHEHMRLVSATGVHQAAADAAAHLRAETDQYSELTRGKADIHAAKVLGEAHRQAERLRAESEAYVQRSLSDLLEVLQKASRTTEKGLARLSGPAQPPAE